MEEGVIIYKGKKKNMEQFRPQECGTWASSVSFSFTNFLLRKINLKGDKLGASKQILIGI